MKKLILAMFALAFTTSFVMAQDVANPTPTTSPAPVELITPEKAIDNAVTSPSAKQKSTIKASAPKAHKKPAHKAKKHKGKKHTHKAHKKHKTAAIVAPEATETPEAPTAQ